MNTGPTFPLVILRIYGIFWILLSLFGLLLTCILLFSGQFFMLFPIAILGIFIGIGFLRDWRFSWIAALLVLATAIAFFGYGLIFSFTTRSQDSYLIIAGVGNGLKVSKILFFGVIFSILGGQVWFLLSKPIRKVFTSKRGSALQSTA
jgi:hypothetical protein